MNISASFRQALAVGGIDIDNLVTITDGEVILINESIPGETTDEEVALAVDISQLKVCVLYAAGALKIETNDGAAPDDTIDLDGTEAFVWRDKYLGDHFTADITSNIFVTNVPATAVVLEGIIIVDPTA